MSSQPPAGWYPDPEHPGQRYWDGTVWTENRAAPAPPVAHKRSIWPWVMVAVFVLVVGGCGLVFVVVTQQHTITQSEFNSVELGTYKSQVIERLGEPEKIQTSQNNDLPSRQCIYYRREGEWSNSYQFCFNGRNRLDSKNSY